MKKRIPKPYFLIIKKPTVENWTKGSKYQGQGSKTVLQNLMLQYINQTTQSYPFSRHYGEFITYTLNKSFKTTK